MGLITLTKMGSTSHLNNKGAGRPKHYAKRTETKQGIFNENDFHCWITGAKFHDQVYPSASKYPTYKAPTTR